MRNESEHRVRRARSVLAASAGRLLNVPVRLVVLAALVATGLSVVAVGVVGVKPAAALTYSATILADSPVAY